MSLGIEKAKTCFIWVWLVTGLSIFVIKCCLDTTRNDPTLELKGQQDVEYGDNEISLLKQNHPATFWQAKLKNDL